MKYVSATDILSDFKKTVDNHFVNSLNKETLCFFVFLCFHKQTKQTLEVLSFMKLEQIIFVKEVVSFMKTGNVSPKLTTSFVGLFLCLLARFPQTKRYFYKTDSVK